MIYMRFTMHAEGEEPCNNTWLNQSYSPDIFVTEKSMSHDFFMNEYTIMWYKQVNNWVVIENSFDLLFST